MCIQIQLFNILLSERKIRHRKILIKGNLMREFYTVDLVIVRNQVKSTRKYRLAQKLLFKTKRPYQVLEKATPNSYWLQSLPFCQGLGRPGIKLKYSAARMEKIPSNMVIHNHIDGADTIFSTITVPLANNPLVKWIGVIRRRTYQASYEDSRRAYEPVSD